MRVCIGRRVAVNGVGRDKHHVRRRRTDIGGYSFCAWLRRSDSWAISRECITGQCLPRTNPHRRDSIKTRHSGANSVPRLCSMMRAVCAGVVLATLARHGMVADGRTHEAVADHGADRGPTCLTWHSVSPYVRLPWTERRSCTATPPAPHHRHSAHAVSVHAPRAAHPMRDRCCDRRPARGDAGRRARVFCSSS